MGGRKGPQSPGRETPTTEEMGAGIPLSSVALTGRSGEVSAAWRYSAVHAGTKPRNWERMKEES